MALVPHGDTEALFRAVNGNLDWTNFSNRADDVFKLYYLGLISAEIDGGEIDGDTYSSYVLDVFVHHNFSLYNASNIDNFFVPFYMFWGYTNTAYGTNQYMNNLVTISTTGGSATKTTSHLSHLLASDPKQEYILFRWIVTWVSGTVTIPAQTLTTQLAIMYSKYRDTTGDTPPQGGGDGVLYEAINIYI